MTPNSVINEPEARFTASIKMKTYDQLQAEYDAKLAELDRLIAENNAKLAANALAMHEAIADAQSAIATAIEKLSK